MLLSSVAELVEKYSGNDRPGALTPVKDHEPKNDGMQVDSEKHASQSVVQVFAQQINDQENRRDALQRQLDAVASLVADELRAAGRIIRPQMIDIAKTKASPSDEEALQKKKIRHVLMREAAVEDALKRAEEQGVQIRNIWSTAAESEARFAISKLGGADYETMVEGALRVLSFNKMAYVLSVSSYKKAGLDVVLSLSSLAESFEQIVPSNTLVYEVISILQRDMQYKRPAPPGKMIEVKLVGPGGTLLPYAKTIVNALDFETEEAEIDDEHGEFYELSVLTGERWRELGLNGTTRWKYLREKDFMALFGMSKSTFEKLPSWKQIPLKKKHGVF